jgi:asparagine synthase (glutamine-hydrolysing)
MTSKLINDTFLDTIYHCERPLFRTAPVPLFKLSELVQQKKMKVVLTGEAADEILFGYDSYKELKLLDFWNKDRSSNTRPLLIKKLYPHLKHFNDERQFELMRMFYEGFLDLYKNELASLNIRINNNRIIQNFLNKDLKVSLDMDKMIDNVRSILPSNHSNWSMLQLNQFLEMKTLLSGYLLSSQGDRMSLAHGVEGRYPFLDHRLVERIFNYKDSYKLHFFSQKHLLRETFRENIPQRIVDRAKMPYQAPDLRAFYHSGSLSTEAQYFLSDEMINEYGIFDPKFTKRFLNKFHQSIPENIGYRDNMIITFLLSTQMAQWWARNPKEYQLPESMKTVDITEN